MDDNKEKCAHPPCKCRAAKDSQYCSAYCEGQGHTAAILCNCGHAACAAS
jgi:hypothetical protein